MTVEKIEKLEELVSSLIDKNKKIVGKEISRLTAPGENNCSIVLKVDVRLKNEDGKEEEINAVAKVMPLNKFTKVAFEIGFKNETAFYDVVIPTLQNFQKEQGVDNVVDIFPKAYTSRVSLDETNEDVDNDAVLLLENLIVSGYKNIDRLVGFDLETTKLILKDLAAFHAIPLALKRTNPDLYEKNIKVYLKGFNPPPPPKTDDGEGPTPPDKIVIDILEGDDEFLPILPILEKNLGTFKAPHSEPDRLFSSICHGDMWVNNIMTKFDGKKPLKNKFVDFQMCTHNSLANDLLFFLLTSVQEPILKENLDELIRIYYDYLIENLNVLKCDTTPFTFKAFLEEIKYVSQEELGHAMGMTCFVVLGKVGGMFGGDGDEEPHPPKFKKEDLTPQAIQRVIFAIRECNKRGWIY